MGGQNFITWLVVGAVVGVLATRVVRDSRVGPIGDVVTGMVGGLVGGSLLPQIGLEIGLGIDPVVFDALAGSIILLFAVRLAARQRSGG
jgi:uncharacterized membrane protein YeaQ/YmgE (transglycosylase-associated protein family)